MTSKIPGPLHMYRFLTFRCGIGRPLALAPTAEVLATVRRQAAASARVGKFPASSVIGGGRGGECVAARSDCFLLFAPLFIVN